MSIAKQITTGIVVAMVATALLLPSRHAAPVINAFTNFSVGSIRGSEGLT
jgi:hypothetical protein